MVETSQTYCKDCLLGTCKIHSEPPPVRHERVPWDEYFMGFAEAAATRSTCLRHQLGAALFKDRKILSTGYNGAPSGLEHCTDTGCMRDRMGIESGTRHELCMAVHAEQNAIIQAASSGTPLKGSEIYITHSPCSVCAKMIINAGIVRVVYKIKYPDEFSVRLLEQAKIELVELDGNENGK
ncbi:MAG: dCMP deaminase family protein [Candidatus Daviesbacteria bacterium]